MFNPVFKVALIPPFPTSVLIIPDEKLVDLSVKRSSRRSYGGAPEVVHQCVISIKAIGLYRMLINLG